MPKRLETTILDHTSGGWMDDFTSYLGVQTSVDQARVFSSTVRKSLGRLQRTQAPDLGKKPGETGFPSFLGPWMDVLSDAGRGTVDGIFWKPLLFQILKPADSSKLLLLVLLSVHSLILVVPFFPLPIPAVPSLRHLKSPSYFLLKLGSHRGYWYSHPSSLKSRMMNDILNYPSPEMGFLF